MRLVVLLPLLLSGCMLIGPPPAEETQGYTAAELDADFVRAKSVSFTIDDFTGNGLGLEVVSAAGHPVAVEVAFDLASSSEPVADGTPRSCISAYSTAHRSLYLSGYQGASLHVRDGALDEGHELGIITSRLRDTIRFDVTSYSEGTSTPVVVGVNERLAWARAGGLIDVTLSSGEAFWYRIREAGDFECRVFAEDGDGGRIIDTGFVGAAKDLQFPFTVDEHNVVGIFIASDGSHQAALRQGSNVISDSRGELGRYSWNWGSGQLPAGDYVWDVADLTGSNGITSQSTLTAVLVHDLDPWMMGAPWDMGSDA